MKIYFFLYNALGLLASIPNWFLFSLTQMSHNAGLSRLIFSDTSVVSICSFKSFKNNDYFRRVFLNYRLQHFLVCLLWFPSLWTPIIHVLEIFIFLSILAPFFFFPFHLFTFLTLLIFILYSHKTFSLLLCFCVHSSLVFNSKAIFILFFSFY